MPICQDMIDSWSCINSILHKEYKLVKQARRNFRPELEVRVKHDIQKLFNAGFIKPIHLMIWLANIVGLIWLANIKEWTIHMLHRFTLSQ